MVACFSLVKPRDRAIPTQRGTEWEQSNDQDILRMVLIRVFGQDGVDNVGDSQIVLIPSIGKTNGEEIPFDVPLNHHVIVIINS